MGLGTKGGGVASAKFAHKHGASVTITDLQTEKQLKESLDQLASIPKTLVLGKHLLQDFEENDIIIKNPGIKYSNKYLQHAIAYCKQIETPISLFIKNYSKPFIGITGTKGKSYTTALVSHLLSTIGIKNIAAGNNCISPLDYLDEDCAFVLELSSWQLHEMGLHRVSPNIACWLNFFPDHMNYYNSENEYFNEKSEIFQNQSKDDFCILPYEDTKIRESAKCSNRILYSLSDLSSIQVSGCLSVCYVKNDKIYYKDEAVCKVIIDICKLQHIYANHQLELLLASICITITYFKKHNLNLDDSILSKINEGLITFKGLEHRFETIFNSDKLTVINDSAASTPESVIRAINSINIDIILILGGGGYKNLDYSTLAHKVIQFNINAILFYYDEPSENLIELFKQYEYTNYRIVRDLEMAIKMALDIIAVKDSEKTTILFSPGCSGYPMYTDMFVRGNIFKQTIMHQLKE